MRHCIAPKFMAAIEEKIGSLDTRCTGPQFDYLIHEIAYVRIGNKLSASKLWWDNNCGEIGVTLYDSRNA